MTNDQHINELLQEELIRYSQVWEDHLLLERGLGINSSDRILSIASAGCNALAMLLCEPEQVVAVDLNPTQTAIVHLKKVAIQRLDYDDFVVLMGAGDGGAPVDLYSAIKSELPVEVREYWDRNHAILESGLIAAGRLEGYFKLLSTSLVQKVCPPEALREFFKSDDLDSQEAFFEQYFTHPEFVQVFKEFTSRKMIASEGRDEVQFRFVDIPDVGQHFYDRFQYVCTKLPARGNFYLEYLMSAAYHDLEVGPPYLRAANYERMRSLLPRLEIVTDGIGEVVASRPQDYFTKANLSDLFEYLSESETENLLGMLADGMKAGGKIAYWNLLVPRHRPESLAHKLARDPEGSTSLWQQDRALFYRNFHIETVQ